jgi:hypothetical protein
MGISGVSDAGLRAVAQTLSSNKLQESVGMAVQKLANNQAKQEGDNAVQLINASAPVGSLGNNIDVKA